ncbi:MAG: hypothetical protein K8R46_01090 [Pirellulales bacterium]|nr:hypothetical protein [Pirellulales bacterium]
MIARRRLFGLVRFSVLSIALVTAGWLVPHTVEAAELDKLDTSLKLVPEDAAFYSSMLRNREQIEAIVNSNAWAKIKEMPAIQMGLMFYNMQLSNPDSVPSKLAEAMENPESRKVIDMLADMASEEIFLCGDMSSADFLQLFQDVQAAQNYGTLMALTTGQIGDMNRIKAGQTISTLAKNVDLIAVPNIVVGFRIKNTELANEQLIKLETIANIILESNEETKGRFKKTKVGDYDFLVLELDGSLVPWDEVPVDKFGNMESEEGDVQKIVERIKQSKLVVAIGIRDEYLLVSIGSSLECLEKLGKGPRLIDREEFKPLAKFADQRLTSVGYLSKAMSRRLNNQKRQIDDVQATVDMLLPEAELSDEQRERIRKDAKEMAEDLKAFVPEAGAIAGFSFLTDRGVESYRYAWGDHGGLDGTKPLGLLQHVGGNPILGVVFRRRVSPENYDLMSKWAKTAYGYFEEFGLPTMPDEDRRKLEEFLEGALPLMERMDKINRELLVPALADGQLALAVDGKLQSKQFVDDMPAAEEPLPMIEPAIIIGLSDAEMFRSAMHDYWDIVNGLIDAMRQVEGTDVPEDIRIPEPQVTDSSEGKVYSFPLPEEWGVDKQIVPNVGISKNAAVISTSPGHTARLLKATPLSMGGLLAETDRPLAVAGWFDWAALVDLATPWIDYAYEQSPGLENVGEDQRQLILVQVHTALEVLKVLRTISGQCYFKDGALVSHTLVELRDVE